MCVRAESTMSKEQGHPPALLGVDDVAARLGVQPTTVHRWCREGRLTCLKPGKSWRVRATSLEAFLRQGERPQTLVDQLRGYVHVPDHLIAVAQDTALLHRLDGAFFQIGDARNALLVKFIGGEAITIPVLRDGFRRAGLAIDRLEGDGGFCWSEVTEPLQERGKAVGRAMAEATVRGREVWASFNWTREVDLSMMIAQQEQLAQMVDPTRLVVKTAAIESVVEDWTPAALRLAQSSERGLIRIAHSGLVLGRSVPLPRE
jgi:excisionase family DNA binding protein